VKEVIKHLDVFIRSIHVPLKKLFDDFMKGNLHIGRLNFGELFYGDWYGTYVPFSSVQSKIFVTVGLNH
jgi:hypothetical protein